MDMIFGYGLAFIFGLVLGVVIFYFFSMGSGSSKAAEELDELKQEHTAYRVKVDHHFLETAELFKDLTERYREVYKHMASGAQNLCTEEVKQLKAELASSNLLTDAGQSGSATYDNQDQPSPEQPKEYVEESKAKAKQKPQPKEEDSDEVPLASEVEYHPDLKAASGKSNTDKTG